jgi:hypothetical protein
MKCGNYQKWLYLFREGELSDRRKKKLERHLRRCKVCAGEKQRIETADSLIRIARDTVPRISNPRELTDGIMNAIEQSTAAAIEESGRFARTTHSWLDRLRMPKVRVALATAAVVMMGMFVFQGALILHRISRLEEKITMQTGKQPRSSSKTPALKHLARAGILRALRNADRMYENLPDDKVVIDKSTLQLLLKLLKDQLRGDDELLQYLRENIPLSDGIKKEELKRILGKKETILKKI